MEKKEVCKNCGACPTCGRTGQIQFIPYPYYTQPIYLPPVQPTPTWWGYPITTCSNLDAGTGTLKLSTC